jgi:hypothetical protein
MPKHRGSADALRVSLLDRRVSNSQLSEVQRLTGLTFDYKRASRWLSRASLDAEVTAVSVTSVLDTDRTHGR